MSSKSYFLREFSLILYPLHLFPVFIFRKTGLFGSPKGFWLHMNTNGFFEIIFVRASMQTRNGRKCLWETCCLEISDFKKRALKQRIFVEMRNYCSLDLSFSWSQRLLAWCLYFDFGIYCQQRKDIDDWAK